MLLRSLCCGSKCCSMLAAFCCKSSGSCKDLIFLCREEQEGQWQMNIKQIVDQILQRNSSMQLAYYRKIWWMPANPDTKKCVGINFVSPRRGHLGKMYRHLAVVGTCRRHVSNFLSQGRGGERSTMVMMFVGGVVLVLDGIPVLFLLQETYDVGVFCPPPNQNSGYAVKRQKLVQPLSSSTSPVNTHARKTCSVRLHHRKVKACKGNFLSSHRATTQHPSPTCFPSKRTNNP